MIKNHSHTHSSQPEDSLGIKYLSPISSESLHPLRSQIIMIRVWEQQQQLQTLLLSPRKDNRFKTPNKNNTNSWWWLKGLMWLEESDHVTSLSSGKVKLRARKTPQQAGFWGDNIHGGRWRHMNNSSEQVERHYAASKHKDEDAEKTGKRQEWGTNTQCYVVFKVPKATTAPMQQDTWALASCNCQRTKTGRAT